MAESERQIKENYEKNLKAEAYLSEMATVWDQIPELLRFMMVFLHDVFRSGKFKGSKLLEIGSGATVHGIASASAYFSNIVMSDFVEDNVDQLKLWLRGDSKLKQFLRFPAEVEGYGKEIDAGIMILESRIRKSVKRVTRCDVLSDGILMDHAVTPDTAPPFDVIISCLTLEVAPRDMQGYANIFMRLNALLRKGGGLVICGFFQGGLWQVGETKFHYLKVKQEDVLYCLQNAGFGNIELKTLKKEDVSEIYYEFDRLFCISAEKL